MEENKTSTILIRLNQETKDKFQKLCKKKAINQSELLRQLINTWIKEQENTEIKHNRVNDIKEVLNNQNLTCREYNIIIEANNLQQMSQATSKEPLYIMNNSL